MQTIFHRILAKNTIAAINNVIEDEIDIERPLKEAELLLDIYNSDDVDERHLIAARAIKDVRTEQLILDWISHKEKA